MRRSTIPVPLTPTIGRSREVATVVELLREGTRLVTITGAGGVGKSRLSVAVAIELTDERDGHVYFVPLACVTDLRTRRIPNALTFGAALAGLLYQFVSGGVDGLGHAAFGWLAGAGIFILPFALGGLFANIYPFGGNTGPLTALHLPIALWLVVGVSYAAVRRRLD